MKAKPKFIYFDLDDTLLDHNSAEQKALADVHVHFDCLKDTSLEDLREVYKSINSRQWKLYSEGAVSRQELQKNRFEGTLNKLGCDSSFHGEVGRYYMSCYRNHWEWIEGAQSAFDRIRNIYEVGILTNGFSETQKAKFEHFDLRAQARHLVISEEVGHLKPDPRIFKHATELTGYGAEEILYIGDSYSSDVIGGTQFGWNVAWYSSNGSEEEHKDADFVFSDFKELSGYLEV